MKVNVTICGTEVPVEVTEEELSKAGYMKCDADKIAEYRVDGVRAMKCHFFDYLVQRMDITSDQSERLIDSSDWDDYFNEVLGMDDVVFVEKVMSGQLLQEMNEKAAELCPEEKYFEVELELFRKVIQTQTPTVVIKVKDEADLRSKLYKVNYCDLEDAIDDYDWEYYENYEDPEIEDWYIVGETDENTGYPILEL